MSTVFTEIIAGRIPGRFVWADDIAVVFSTIAPITDGHVLVVPRAEVPELTQASDELLAHLTVVAKTIGVADHGSGFSTQRSELSRELPSPREPNLPRSERGAQTVK